MKKRFGSVVFDLYFYTSKIILLSELDDSWIQQIKKSLVQFEVQFNSLENTNTSSSSINFKRLISTKMILFECSVLLGTENEHIEVVIDKVLFGKIVRLIERDA